MILSMPEVIGVRSALVPIVFSSLDNQLCGRISIETAIWEEQYMNKDASHATCFAF
jgi:hypothetical protein